MRDRPSLVEILAGAFDRSDPVAAESIQRPGNSMSRVLPGARPYVGQNGVLPEEPMRPPPWARNLPRLQARPPAMPIGPGGVTGDPPPPPDALRVPLSEAQAENPAGHASFADWMMAQQPLAHPSIAARPSMDYVNPRGGPVSDATFAPGTGQPAPAQPQDDLDAIFAAALNRARLSQTGRRGVAQRKTARPDLPRTLR